MITMNNFRQCDAGLEEQQLAAMQRVLESGWWVLGQEVAAFETEWADYVGVNHAVGVGNGMDAIEIGLRCLGIGADDEVITTPMTAFATVLAILRAGARPVLADIDPLTAMITPESIARCLSARTRAVVVVHLYGQAARIEEIAELCRSRGLKLIEDCAQAHGARVNGRSVGTFGDCAAWSFYPTKNLGCIGDGGAITTNSEAMAATARALRNYGQSERYHHPHLGLNSRLDELQAAILRERLPHLTDWVLRRRQIAERYVAGIHTRWASTLPLPEHQERHAHHLFIVTTEHRTALQEHLRDHGVESLCHYPVAVHQQPPCRNMDRDPKGLANAERHAERCLSIPCRPGLSDADVNHVIETINRFSA